MRKFSFIFQIFIVGFIFVPKVLLCQVATAVWSFASDASATTTTGSITTYSSTNNGYSSISYGNAGTPNFGKFRDPSGWWTAEDQTKYIEYKVSPISGYNLNITSVSVGLCGSSANLRVFIAYSTDRITWTHINTTAISIANSTTATTYSSGTTPMSSVNQTVYNGSPFYVRLYAYITTAASSKYLHVSNMTISGTTSVAGTPPTVSTTSASSTSAGAATGTGSISSVGTSNIISSGFCWSTTQGAESVTGSHSTDGPTGATTGSFTSDMIGLTGGQTYYVKAYATSADGTGYGEETSFTTPTAYYRTKAAGDWEMASTWEYSTDNNSWSNAAEYPDISATLTTISHNVNYTGTPAVVGDVIVTSGANLINSNSLISINSNKTMIISSGAFYENRIDNATISAGSGSMQVNGTYKLTALNSNSQIAFTNVTFASGKSGGTLYIGGSNAPRLPLINSGNVVWEASGSNTFINGNTTIEGDFTINNSYTVINNGSGGTGRSLTVNGDLILNNGQYNPMGRPGASSTTQSFTINGNVYLSGSGKLYAAQPTSSLGMGIINIKGNINIQNGATSVVLSGGAKNLGTLVLNKSSAQNINIDPMILTSQYTIDSLTIINSAGVNLNTDLSLGVLYLSTGALSTGSNTLTLKGAVSGSGSINANSGTVNFEGGSEQTFSSTISAATTLNINAGSKLTNNGNITATTLNILSDATNGTGTLTNNGTLTITTTNVSQYLADARNWYVSCPVVSSNLPSSGYTFYNYNEATNNWDTPSAFEKGKGYIALPGVAASTLTFTGTLNTGNVNVDISNSGSGSTKGFNLIGNPYPCHLTWTKTFVDNNTATILPTIWYRTNAGTTNNSGQWTYKTYNASTGEASPAGTTGIIPPMQAFWVKAAAEGTLTLNSDLTKSHQSSNPLKVQSAVNTERQRLRLQVSNGTATDETLVYFDAAASNNFDRYDSPKLFTTSASMAEIYTQTGSEKLVINGMSPFTGEKTIPLGFVAQQAGNFSISAIEIGNFDSGVKIMLKDNQAGGSEFDLTGGAVYNFSSAASSASTDRFSVVLRSPSTTTGVQPARLKGQVYVDASNRVVLNTVATATYSIYNSNGQEVLSGTTNPDNTILTGFRPAAGIYLVKVQSEGKMLSSHIVIR